MKVASFPLYTFDKANELSKTVSDLGGSCTQAICAAKMKKKVSGAFRDLVSAAVKFGLITNKNGNLALTEAYKAVKLAYSPEEETEQLRKLFLNPPLYLEIYNKYKDVSLPIDILEKALVKEFGVPEQHASRISNHFIKDARKIGLLGENNVFIEKTAQTETPKEKTPKEEETFNKKTYSNNGYTIHIVGPDIDSKLNITEGSDLHILDAILKKVKSKLPQGE